MLSQVAAAAELTVGSKRFTESYILAEIVAVTARNAGEANVVVRPGLGNTAVVFAALKTGAIDIYPEYTGTIVQELLQGRSGSGLKEINAALAPMGLAASVPLGFNNTYALALAESRAQPLSIKSVSDLTRYPKLTLGLSPEFVNRQDGWNALQREYGLPFTPRNLDHGLAYEALAAGHIDVMDIYRTDAKIAQYKLRVLKDDRKFFPEYAAVLLYRSDLPQRLPATWAALQKLEGSIPSERMIAMNAAAEIDGRSFVDIAAQFTNASTIAKSPTTSKQSSTAGNPPRKFSDVLFGADFIRLTVQHLVLVFASLALSVIVGVPLGIWAARARVARAVIFPVTAVLQTIPSLALLAFLITLLHQIGTLPALVALFLYGLLPIVRNTVAGLAEVGRGLRQAGAALGLRPGIVLWLIELPLAARTILAGIRTSAVINVGTATIAAFIGAGGYGERIVAGLAVNDSAMLLAGALPAAVLALLIEGGFGLIERWVTPPGRNSSR